mmetsp:Transcript_173944/g.557573  ORF Transcript_173944/g.557573 Transcript_173944/m.557573 type:complete len:219 (+) Transcript_173944:811-1467(+)
MHDTIQSAFAPRMGPIADWILAAASGQGTLALQASRGCLLPHTLGHAVARVRGCLFRWKLEQQGANRTCCGLRRHHPSAVVAGTSRLRWDWRQSRLCVASRKRLEAPPGSNVAEPSQVPRVAVRARRECLLPRAVGISLARRQRRRGCRGQRAGSARRWGRTRPPGHAGGGFAPLSEHESAAVGGDEPAEQQGAADADPTERQQRPVEGRGAADAEPR